MKAIFRYLIHDNPVFILLLGLCPTLAVTTSAINGLGMGIATMVVLLGSNILVSLLRNVTPSQIRIPMFITIIASFVTIVDMLMAAFVPELHKSMGIFIPLIVVNCIILGRAEAFACKNSVYLSILDAIHKSFGYTFALVVLGSIRELLGSGAVFGFNVLGSSYQPMLIMILPPGAFIILGFLIAIFNRKASAA